MDSCFWMVMAALIGGRILGYLTAAWERGQ